MEEKKYFYADRNNATVGPFTVAELRSLLVNGQVSSETYVAEQGEQGWKPLGSVLALAGGAGSGPASPPPRPAPDHKSKLAAGLLGIFLGAFGVHNFYLGWNGKGVAQLLITVLSLGLLAFVTVIWGLIEGIMVLTGSIDRDAAGRPLRD